MSFNCSLSVVLLFVLTIGQVQADSSIYRYIDPQGRLILTDTPKNGNYIRLVKTNRGWVPQSRYTLNLNNKKALSPTIRRAADKHNIPYRLIHAVIRAESAYNPHAVSHAGAQGLMQLMPATAQRFGVRDPFNPTDNINGGSEYLSYLLKLFKGDYKLALAAYNAGEHTVQRYGNRIPPYKETQNYVRKVLTFYKHYPAS